jgi:hypothetical protein
MMNADDSSKSDDQDDDDMPVFVSRSRGRSFYGNDPPMMNADDSGGNDTTTCSADGDVDSSGSGGSSIAVRMAAATERAIEQTKVANAAAQIQRVARGNRSA